MKYFIPLLTLFLFTACTGPEEETPDETGNPSYDEEVVSLLEDVEGGGETETETEAETEATEADAEENIVACRETNAQLDLEMSALEKRNEELQEALSNLQGSSTGNTIPEKYLEMIRNALMETEQEAFAFTECGTMGSFLRSSWYGDFTESLAEQKIRFSSGYLEPEDLFGGCYSSGGGMAFFLGAEREEDAQLFVIKYDTEEGQAEAALLLDGAADAIVTQYGSRDGAFIPLPADDERSFHYYYDANIVVQE